MALPIISLPSVLLLASLGFQWPVVLAIDVDEAGEVQRVEVLHSAGPSLDEAALNAATHFRFDPSPGRGPTRILHAFGP